MNKSDTSQTHGGKREGAGRKAKFGEPTTLMRVPESAKPVVADFLNELAQKRLEKAKWPAHLTPIGNPPSR